MRNIWKKNIKENAKENIVIFSLLLSLKISEENKREREEKSWRKFYQAHIIFFIESPIHLTSSSLVVMDSHHHCFNNYHHTPTIFQYLQKPTLFRYTSSHGWIVLFKSSQYVWIHVFIPGMDWIPLLTSHLDVL